MIFLFDIDGTLLLSGGSGRVALDRAMDLHLPVTGAMGRISCAGKTDRSIIEEACRNALGRDPGDDLVGRIRDSYTEYLPGELSSHPSFRLMPGVPHVLHALRRRKRTWLAVATGNIEPGARFKLERAGLDQLPLSSQGLLHGGPDHALHVAAGGEVGSQAVTLLGVQGSLQEGAEDGRVHMSPVQGRGVGKYPDLLGV